MSLKFSRYAFLLLAMIIWFSPPSLAVEQPSPEEEEPDYTEEEYNALQQALNETNPARKEDLLLAFLQAGHKSKTLNDYALQAYMALYGEYQKQGNYERLGAAAEKFLRLQPDDVTSLGLAADAFQRLGNTRKFIEYGEKFYAKKPVLITAYYIAQGYKSLNNLEKFAEWAEKIINDINDNAMLADISVELFRYYAQQSKPQVAAKYARVAVKALEGSAKPPGNITETAWRQYKESSLAAAHFLIGEELYDKERFRDALASYQRSLNFNCRNDAAYYRMGFAYWRLEQHNEALESFARASLLNGPTSSDAKKRVEEIYKPFHNNTTIGIDKVFDRARASLKQAGCL